MASGATFDVNNRTETVSSLAGAGTVTLGTGTGTLIVAGAGTSTTFSGAINGATGDKLQLNAGTTFTLGKSNVFGDATTLALNGGTLAVGGSFSDTVGRLTLAASSSLNYINNTSTLTFTDANRTAGTLTIYNWAGDLSGGGASQLKFTNAETGFANTNIVFDGYTTGSPETSAGRSSRPSSARGTPRPTAFLAPPVTPRFLAAR